MIFEVIIKIKAVVTMLNKGMLKIPMGEERGIAWNPRYGCCGEAIIFIYETITTTTTTLYYRCLKRMH